MGFWYPIERNWTENSYAWELWNPKPSNQSYCVIPIAVPKAGNYTFVLRYLDGSASSIEIELDDNLIGRIRYDGTNQARSFGTDYFVDSSGLHSIKITLMYPPGLPQYACLDYLRISFGEMNA